MKIIRPIIWILFTIGLILICDRPLTIGELTLPPIGKFLNPATGFWQNADNAKSAKSLSLNFENLKEEVKVRFDKRMVPHIFAQNIDDALFVQGYLHAKYRLWQMDFSTRAASGRLSEVIGKRTLNYDKSQLRKGMLYAAENMVKASENSTFRKSVESFRDGANAYLANLKKKDFPLEFKLLDYEPEPWTILKTALFTKNMAQTLASREDDLEHTNSLNILGQSQFDFFFPEVNSKDTSTIIPWSQTFPFNNETIPNEMENTSIGNLQIRKSPSSPEVDPYHVGSNNWAVAGSKTKSGNPILCSDPHLALSLPSIWFENQIHTPEFNSYGVSLPGIPGVIIGFNEHVAWGITNVGQDVSDWYKIDWVDDSKTYYWLDGQKKEVTNRIEKIEIRNGETILDTVPYTIWGPVAADGSDYQDMALRWLPHDASNPEELSTFYKLNKAKNHADYIAALSTYDSPAQNFVFASTDQDIAIQVTGKFPIRKKGTGKFVMDGSKSENAWKGYIPKAHVPHVKNPARGFVSSANQRSTGPNYPYDYFGSFEDYRNRRLNRLLTEKEKMTFEDMKAIQLDDYSVMAEEGLPILLRHLDKRGLQNNQLKIIKSLENWDYTYDAENEACIYFEKWFWAFYRKTFDEFYAMDSIYVVQFPDSWRLNSIATSQENHEIFDINNTKQKETIVDIVQLAFDKMIADIEKMELENKSLKWTAYQNTKINHLLSIPAFSKGGLGNAGRSGTLNATSSRNGPSWRMIVDLRPGDVQALGIYPGGQSGNPGSKHYDEMVDNWAKGNYYVLDFLKSADIPFENESHSIQFKTK